MKLEMPPTSPFSAPPSPEMNPFLSAPPSPSIDGNPFLTDDELSPNNSAPGSNNPSRPSSASGRPRNQQGVRFGIGETLDLMGNRIAVGLRDEGSPEYDWQMLGDSSRVCSSPEIGTGEYYAQNSDFPISNTQIAGMPSGPRDPISLRIPPIAFGYRNPRVDEDDEKNEKYDVFHPHGGSRTTEERTARYMTVSGSFSAPTSARNSPEPRTPVQDISMLTLANQSPVTDIVIRTGEDAVRPGVAATKEAHQLVRQHTRRGARSGYIPFAASKPIAMPHCGFATPTNHAGEDYVQRPEQYRGGVLSSLLSLYNAPQATEPARLGHNHSSSLTSISTSGRTTPKWYNKSANSSSTSLGGVIAASGSTLVSPATAGMNMGSTTNGFGQVKRPKIKHRPHSTGFVDKIKNISKPGLKLEEEIRITVHIAETLQRQKYIIKICRALMIYGAPTHRLEEALKMTSRVLEIDAQFLYIPGCMIIAFGDQSTHTSDMQIVRVEQGLDIGKLQDCHTVYKEVVHDVIGVEEAIQTLDSVMTRKPIHNRWFLVFVYGLASATVGPFGFGARAIDIPILFLLGCILGILQLFVAPMSELYSNIFEISTAIITSFLARAFGSIRGGDLFCFSTLAQSSIALILPGYIILCGSLELQSRNIVAGSVRMFYAVIYSLMLGFGITIGSAFYGILDKNATSETTCRNPMNWRWNFLFVPLFAACLLTINRAKWKEAPVMIIIATAGYVVNYFSGLRFAGSPQVANGLGALTIGVLGNLYSRMGHGLAFAAMLPAIFVQVPSGLAAQGSLLSGIQSADALVDPTAISSISGQSAMFELAGSMIQIAIGITVGLFVAALVVYPLGKRRSGLFSF